MKVCSFEVNCVQLSEYGCTVYPLNMREVMGTRTKWLRSQLCFCFELCETLTYQYLSHGLGSEATNIFEDSAWCMRLGVMTNLHQNACRYMYPCWIWWEWHCNRMLALECFWFVIDILPDKTTQCTRLIFCMMWHDKWGLCSLVWHQHVHFLCCTLAVDRLCEMMETAASERSWQSSSHPPPPPVCSVHSTHVERPKTKCARLEPIPGWI